MTKLEYSTDRWRKYAAIFLPPFVGMMFLLEISKIWPNISVSRVQKNGAILTFKAMRNNLQYRHKSFIRFEYKNLSNKFVARLHNGVYPVSGQVSHVFCIIYARPQLTRPRGRVGNGWSEWPAWIHLSGGPKNTSGLVNVFCEQSIGNVRGYISW